MTIPFLRENNNFFSSVSVFAVHTWDHTPRCIRSDIEPWCTVPCLQADKTVFVNMSEERWTFDIRTAAPASAAPHACVMVPSWTRVEDRHSTVHSFITLRLNHWYHMDCFNDVLPNFLGLECGSDVAVFGGSEKYLNLCSDDERRSYGFGTAENEKYIFGWTTPFILTLEWFLNHHVTLKFGEMPS